MISSKNFAQAPLPILENPEASWHLREGVKELKKLKRTLRILTTIIMVMAMFFPLVGFTADTTEAATVIPGTIDPTTIPMYVNQLSGAPPVYTYTTNATARQYTVYMDSFNQQILPAVINPATGLNFPMTKVWGYGGQTNAGLVYNSPGPSFEAVRGTAIDVKYVNNVGNGLDKDGNPSNENYMFAVDPSLHWANPNNIDMNTVMTQTMAGIYPLFPPGYDGTVSTSNPSGFNAQSPVPLVTHLHGAEVQSYYDGGPNEWFTNGGVRGSNYSSYVPAAANEAVYHYPNTQQGTTLWYHDHALGLTRLNVMSGLAGFYFLRDPADPVDLVLPTGAYEMPLAIQDRIFNLDGSLYFPSTGLNPTMHPYWMPEFFGNTIMVDGKVWPNMNVD